MQWCLHNIGDDEFENIIQKEMHFLSMSTQKTTYLSFEETVASRRQEVPINELLAKHVDENKTQRSLDELIMWIQNKLDIQGDQINLIQYQIDKVVDILAKMAKEPQVTNRGKEVLVHALRSHPATPAQLKFWERRNIVTREAIPNYEERSDQAAKGRILFWSRQCEEYFRPCYEKRIGITSYHKI